MTDLRKQIDSHLKILQLSGIIPIYKQYADKAAKNKCTYEEYLAILLEQEINRKNEGSVKAKITKARFPFLKTLEEFDFSFQPNIRETEIIGLSSLDFIENKQNVILLGPPGVGKTHIAVALGLKACIAKYRVIFTTVQDIIEDLTISHKDGSLMDKILAYSRLQLLIIDELGYMPISKEQANLLFQLISIRYEKSSIILTSNYNFDEWGKIFQDTVVASAIIDRLVHHSSIFFINGSSYRLKGKFKNLN